MSTRYRPPVLTRSLEDLRQAHPRRASLQQLILFVREVLLPGGPVVGVVLTGDLGVHPLIELIVVLEDGRDDLPSAILWNLGSDRDPRMVELGIRWWPLDRLARQRWQEGLKYALSQGVLLWDERQLLRSFLETRLWYPDALRCHRLLDNSIRLEALLGDGEVAALARTGDLIRAHHLLTHGLDRVIDHLFDYHQVWRPPVSRQLAACLNLDWLPPHFEDRLERALTLPTLSVDGLLDRKAAVETLFESVQTRVELEPWWPQQPHEHWRATVGGL